MQTDLPIWSFDAARYLCEGRSGRFGNRFASAKLRGLHKAEPYFKHSEGIIGYLGDIAAAITLGLDPVEMLEDMIVATDGLAHRDEYDMFFHGWSIDSKIEDFREHHESVIAGGLGYRDPYGCRLINAIQYEQNKGGTDVYLFGCFDPPMDEGRLLHDIGRVRWLGWVGADVVENAVEQGYSPAGPRLPMKARLIPHSSLRPIEELLSIDAGSRARPRLQDRQVDEPTAARIAMLRAELRAICGRA